MAICSLTDGRAILERSRDITAKIEASMAGEFETSTRDEFRRWRDQAANTIFNENQPATNDVEAEDSSEEDPDTPLNTQTRLTFVFPPVPSFPLHSRFPKLPLSSMPPGAFDLARFAQPFPHDYFLQEALPPAWFEQVGTVVRVQVARSP